MPKKSRTKKKAASGGRLSRLLPSEELRRRVSTGAKITAAIAVVVGLVAVSWEVRSTVEADPRFRLENWELDFGGYPAWVTPEIRGELDAIRLVGGESLSLFDRGVLEDMRVRIAGSPWVSRVGEVQLDYPTSRATGRVRVAVELREPIALVQVGSFYYLASHDGVRLGEPYATAPTSWFGVPVVTGVVDLEHLPSAGEPWTGRDLLEGLEVARVLRAAGIRQEFPDTPIERVDVSNIGGRVSSRDGDVVLHCDGRRLVWGRSPLSRGSRTISTRELLENLRTVLLHIHEADWKLVMLHYPEPVVVGNNG